MSPFVIINFMGIFVSTSFLVLHICLYGWNEKYLSMDSGEGFFGWMDKENLFNSLVLVGPFGQLLGNGGYAICMAIASPVVVGNIYLLQPFIGQIVGVIVGVD